MLSLLLRSLQNWLDIMVMCISNCFWRYGEKQEEVSFFFCCVIFMPFPFFPLLLGEFTVRSRLPVCFFFLPLLLFICNYCYLNFSDSAVLHSEGGVLSLVLRDA